MAGIRENKREGKVVSYRFTVCRARDITGKQLFKRNCFGGVFLYPETGKVPAPDFAVYDRDSHEVYLSDFVGKPVALNFWASRCGPCRSETPGFDAAYAELGEKIHFLMGNLTASSADAYGACSLPAAYFIDADL